MIQTQQTPIQNGDFNGSFEVGPPVKSKHLNFFHWQKMHSTTKSLNATCEDIFEKTIPNDESDDIIECSIVENEMQSKFKYKKNYETESKSITAFSGRVENSAETRSFCKFQNINTSLRLSLLKTFENKEDAMTDAELNCNSIETPKKISRLYDKTDTAYNRVLWSLKKQTEVAPHLSKSKLQNIQQWLQCNDFDIARTPPFANSNMTPENFSKKRKTKRRKETENSSIDSDVEGVLKAVYGNDWVKENVKIKCKTEPKRRLNKNFSPFSKGTKSIRSLKKCILTSRENNFMDTERNEKNVSFDDSIISGVKMINFDDSATSPEVKCLRNDNEKQKTKLELNEAKFITKLSSSNRKKLNEFAESDSLKIRRRMPNKLPMTANLGLESDQVGKRKKTFLASLSISTPTSKCHPDAKYYKINFKSKKDELVRKLFKLYNSEVFGGQLADDMNFSWNIKLRGTAGYCYNKRITKSTGEILRQSRIEFSTKIVDRADRLRDTMIHELCHAASWVIDAMLDGHGHVWNAWATKAMERFPELPTIKRCHNYDIVSKYQYRCINCGYIIKRHSKSINTERKRCGHCFGTLELLVNKKRKGKKEVPEFEATRTLRPPNKFALFVKENYHHVKSVRKSAKHNEIMKVLSQQYALTKTNAKADQ